jgi:hypothetical protein
MYGVGTFTSYYLFLGTFLLTILLISLGVLVPRQRSIEESAQGDVQCRVMYVIIVYSNGKSTLKSCPGYGLVFEQLDVLLVLSVYGVWH